MKGTRSISGVLETAGRAEGEVMEQTLSKSAELLKSENPLRPDHGIDSPETGNMLHQINLVNDEINSLFHKASEKLGLADSEMRIFYLLCDYPDGLTQSDILAFTGISKQTIHSAVNRMENAGWLARGQRIAHRRKIRLTDEGRRVAEEKIGPFRTREKAILTGWNEEEREIFLTLNERYRDALSQIVKELGSARS